MKILNFGSCNIDYVYSLDHIVKSGETENSDRLEIYPGGKGLNQSIAIARAGGEVYHAGCIGSDGEFLLAELEKSGVDTRFVKKVTEKNGHAIIQVNIHGENSIFLYAGSNAMVDRAFIDETLNSFSQNDIIVLQNEINNLKYIVDRAYEKNMTIVLNPSPFNEKICELDLKKISYLILNETEAESFSGADTPEEAISFFNKNYPELKIMLTLGSRGCIYGDKNSFLTCPAFEVKAVDTTAAGDTFTGYFVTGISKGADFRKILKTASAASAISVSKAGASPSIPYFSEVEALISLLKPKSLKKDEQAEMLLKKINAYVSENIKSSNAPTLGGLANALGYSAVYTGSLVKKLTKKSFTELVMQKRCEEAARLLRETNMSVSEIINAVGYENESFFRRAFKERYAKSPAEYRKNSL